LYDATCLSRTQVVVRGFEDLLYGMSG